MPTSINKLVGTFYEAANGKPDLLDAVITDDWDDIPLGHGQEPGRAGARSLIEGLSKTFSDLRFVVEEIIDARGDDGNGMVGVRARMHGVRTGEVYVIAPIGRQTKVRTTSTRSSTAGSSAPWPAAPLVVARGVWCRIPGCSGGWGRRPGSAWCRRRRAAARRCWCGRGSAKRECRSGPRGCRRSWPAARAPGRAGGGCPARDDLVLSRRRQRVRLGSCLPAELVRQSSGAGRPRGR